MGKNNKRIEETVETVSKVKKAIESVKSTVKSWRKRLGI